MSLGGGKVLKDHDRRAMGQKMAEAMAQLAPAAAAEAQEMRTTEQALAQEEAQRAHAAMLRSGSARVISQATFNDAVRENIEEFEQELEEAIADAIEQFAGDGVDLSVINTGADCLETTDAIPKVLVAKLTACSSCGDDRVAWRAAVLAALAAMTAKIKANPNFKPAVGAEGVINAILAIVRVAAPPIAAESANCTVKAGMLGAQLLAGGGYAMVVGPAASAEPLGAVVEECEGEDGAAMSMADVEAEDIGIVERCFFTLATLCARCPENRAFFESAFPDKACTFCVAAARLLADYADQPVLERVYACAFYASNEHEGNKMDLFTCGLGDAIFNYFSSPVRRERIDATRQACNALVSMAAGDDMVTSESKASDRAKEFANSELPGYLIAAIDCHAASLEAAGAVDAARAKVLVALMEALEMMCITDTLCEMLEEAGAIAAAHRLLVLDGAVGDDILNAPLMKATLSFLAAVARRDSNKDIVAGRTDIVVAVMIKYNAKVKGAAVVQTAAMRALAAATLRRAINCKVLVMHGAHNVTAAAMRAHGTSATVQRQACVLLRNIISQHENKEFVPLILADNVEAMVRAARVNHSNCQDVSFAALRDLGCDITDMSHYRLKH